MKIRSTLTSLVILLLAFNLFCGCGGGETTAQKEASTKIQTAAETPAAPANPAAAATPAAPAAPAGPTTTLNFDETEFDYGVVDQGEKVNHTYKFKNTGTEPLIISNAKGSCGCTVPSWPKEPIPVGGSGEIAVQFDSKGKKGKQSKKVTITANTEPAQTFLVIKGEVNAPEAEATKK